MKVFHLKIILIFIFGQLLTAKGQTLEFVRSIPFEGIQQVSLDRYNFLYVSDQQGNIKKFDEEGKFQVLYSPAKVSNVALLEAWNTIKVFVFYREFQEYVILERFLTPRPNYVIDENAIGFARMATLASDYNLWMFDDADFSLKKYDQQYNKVLFSTPLDLILKPKDYDIKFMREFQNQLFISDINSGILVFDLFGNYKKKIPFQGVSFFSFFNDYLTFISGTQIVWFDLYGLSEIRFDLPSDKKYIQAIVTSKYTYLFAKDAMEIYTYKLESSPKQEKK